MDNKNRINELNAERDSIYKRLYEIDDELILLEEGDEMAVAKSKVGKFYKNSTLRGNEIIFHPKEVSCRSGLKLYTSLVGEWVSCNTLLIGDIETRLYNNMDIEINELNEYEEITEEEYNEIRENAIKPFVK